MSDQSIEGMIVAKGKTAARITPDEVEANIVSEFYFTAQNGVVGANSAVNGPLVLSLSLLTFCVLILRNGTKVVGINYGPVSPENFDAKKGREEARKDAVEEIWPLMGYELRNQLAWVEAVMDEPIAGSKAVAE